MAADRTWHPVSLSGALERGTSTGTHLFGREIVVWRDLEGVAHAWEDRCPHRGMRLSLGFVRGNQIACLYHGWHYDTAGQCRYIPAHPQLTPPDTIRVGLYGCAERVGMVWVFATEPDAAPVPPEEQATTQVRSISIDRPAVETIAHLTAAGAVEIAPSLFGIAVDGLQVIAGVQPIDADESALHIALTGDRFPGDVVGVDRRRISDWAEGLRREIEAAPPAVAGEGAE